MERKLSVEAEVFLDTAYAIALASVSDHSHAVALRLADELEDAGTRLVTTRAILMEIGNALSKLRYRQAAVRLLEAIESDPKITIIPFSGELYASALKLYRERPDKEWGLIDCVSFVVMQEHGLTEALTTDDHYRQPGYKALMRDPV